MASENKGHGATATLTSKMTTVLGPDDRDITFTRMYDAPQKLVFRAWTEPARLSEWWGPKDFSNPICFVDLHRGGAYRIVMRAPDGTEYPVKGVYEDVVPYSRLVMTISAEDHPEEWHALINKYRVGADTPAMAFHMTVTFDEVGVKTRLTIHSHFRSSVDRDATLKMGAVEGWSQSLDRLEELLAKG